MAFLSSTAEHIQTLSRAALHMFAQATQSSPKPQKVTPPPRASQQAVSQPASGVRYTDGHYTCSTADIRALRAAGYDSSSSRQTIRCQRRAGVRAVQSQHKHEDRLQPDAPHCTARPPSRVDGPFQRASRQLLCESSYNNLRSQLFHAPAAVLACCCLAGTTGWNTARGCRRTMGLVQGQHRIAGRAGESGMHAVLLHAHRQAGSGQIQVRLCSALPLESVLLLSSRDC